MTANLSLVLIAVEEQKKNQCNHHLIKTSWELFTSGWHSGDFEQHVFGLALLRYWRPDVVRVAVLVVVRVGRGQVHRQVLHVVHLRVQNQWALRVGTAEDLAGHKQRRFGPHLVFGFQRDGINHTDVVGLRGGKVVVSVFDEVAAAVVGEVGHGVVQKGNGPEKRWASSGSNKNQSKRTTRSDSVAYTTVNISTWQLKARKEASAMSNWS